ncbi:MAG: tRNA pseudouridine38-40 synthase [Candidatus Latescibacterota bacterium]|jgi:tRNA pseudouridine38-40 synthase
MRTIRLIIEYDGSDFVGWQVQSQGRTVQGELARALKTLVKEDICPTGSGRTDAGTHALGQVAHFQTLSSLPIERIQRSLNGLLPADITIHAVEEADDGFHARYSAKRKRYRYRIHEGKNSVSRNFTWTCFRPLNFDSLEQASLALPGTHSFGAFCKQDPVPDNFHCTLYAAQWQRQGRELVFEIEGKRFLRHMVRILVGTMIEVGLGQRPASDMKKLLENGQREAAGHTAPACGLHLLWVRYGD